MTGYAAVIFCSGIVVSWAFGMPKLNGPYKTYGWWREELFFSGESPESGVVVPGEMSYSMCSKLLVDELVERSRWELKWASREIIHHRHLPFWRSIENLDGARLARACVENTKADTMCFIHNDLDPYGLCKEKELLEVASVGLDGKLEYEHPAMGGDVRGWLNLFGDNAYRMMIEEHRGYFSSILAAYQCGFTNKVVSCHWSDWQTLLREPLFILDLTDDHVVAPLLLIFCVVQIIRREDNFGLKK